jgi:hypothetical protein
MKYSIIVAVEDAEDLEKTLLANLLTLGHRDDVEFILVGAEQPEDADPRCFYVGLPKDVEPGTPQAANVGARVAEGETLAFVRSDDLIAVDFLPCADWDREHGFRTTAFFPGRLVVERTLFFEAGGFDEELQAGGYEDVDLFERLKALAGPGRWSRRTLPATSTLRRRTPDRKAIEKNSQASIENMKAQKYVANGGEFGKGKVTINGQESVIE